MVPVADRPNDADDRQTAGHWEGDLICGAHNRSAIKTLVDRSTRTTLLVHMAGRVTAEHLRDELVAMFNELPPHLKRSLLWDQGIEMSRHGEFARTSGVDVYFCAPHSPWQRGTNENTNGLLRQYFPKGTDLNIHSPERLQQVAEELNNRPRKCLDWSTPNERIASLQESSSDATTP